MVICSIGLGVALGTSGVMIAENLANDSAIIPYSTIMIIDHSIGTSSISGTYKANALTYEIERYNNEIEVGLLGLPGRKTIPANNGLRIIFDGQSIPPDGIKRRFTLKGGETYLIQVE